MKNLLIAILFFGTALTAFGQNINKYKYVLIPETYEFTGGKDQYQLNSLTKFLLNKEGFNTLMTTEKKPEDLKRDPCFALSTKLKDNSGIFVTKLILVFEDCTGTEVFRSKEGRSREKDFKAAYHEALRDAFESIQQLNYGYDPDVQQPKTVEVEGEEESNEVAEEIEKVLETEEASKEIQTKLGSAEYEFEGQSYSVKTLNDRLGLFQQNSSEPVAILIPSENENYIYNSLTLQGVAYFDDRGNLVVEYFDSSKNEKVRRKYELLDQ